VTSRSLRHDLRRTGDRTEVSETSRRLTEAERRRRRDVLDALKEATALRARLRPRASQLERARALLHARTTRG
jgi:hypothetical protein